LAGSTLDGVASAAAHPAADCTGSTATLTASRRAPRRGVRLLVGRSVTVSLRFSADLAGIQRRCGGARCDVGGARGREGVAAAGEEPLQVS
jgi:hypothetical protein